MARIKANQFISDRFGAKGGLGSRSNASKNFGAKKFFSVFCLFLLFCRFFGGKSWNRINLKLAAATLLRFMLTQLKMTLIESILMSFNEETSSARRLYQTFETSQDYNLALRVPFCSLQIFSLAFKIRQPFVKDQQLRPSEWWLPIVFGFDDNKTNQPRNSFLSIKHNLPNG